MSAASWLDAQLRASGFLGRFPYYAAVLARLRVVQDPTVRWLAVSLEEGRYYLHVNPDTFAGRERFLPGILLHEVHHIVLGHLASERLQRAQDRELLELAMEMSANEYVREPLPDPILCAAFAHLGVRPGQSTLERYELLCEARAKGRLLEVPRPDGTVDDHRPWRDARPDGGALERTRRLVADAVESARAQNPDAPLPASAPQWLLAGRDPGSVLESLQAPRETGAPPRDWRTLLRLFVTHRRAPAPTWSRPSRRFPERVGQVPGRSYALQRTHRPSLLVVLDTSSSIASTTLERVAAELRALSAWARFTVLECDAAVQRSYPFEGALPSVKGRGGTDLRPALEPSVLRAHRAEGVVYFTDGRGPCPEQAPPVPVLWVLTPGHALECDFGQRVELDG